MNHLKKPVLPIVLLVILVTFGIIGARFFYDQPITGALPYGESEEDAPALGELDWLRDWKRPDGPARVGVQIGHLNNEDAPEEQKRLRNNGGATGGGYTEVEVNAAVAEELKRLLASEGVLVDLLPTTIPPDYWADVFVSVHTDGNTNPTVSGFKIASSWRDLTGTARELVAILESSYQEATRFPKDPNISRNMRGYYAFSWWRYEHAIHPKTTAAIVEMGFITNPGDRKILVGSPEIPARGLADGVLKYLRSQNLLED